MAKITLFTRFNGTLDKTTEFCPTKENALKRVAYYRNDRNLVKAVISDGKEMIIC